ncbi:hypothetical protein K432DRAFT_418427 [Lepidopterella palustris CBS 459.81]|uniref:Uncharacterized protein n=1 Tax=Lepidopterella palustris CBS 459.81 TaxID=1314670 RepID=A0A8E2E5V3_9PEZI|nr:hypothetical protein K432DRAFT_418427 [Lepidopterella palustris CBS 459.81]
MQKPPEYRIMIEFAQTLIREYRDIAKELGNDMKFFMIVLDPYERDIIIWVTHLVHTILDFLFTTIALITGHLLGRSCILTPTHDYRVTNSVRGFWCMPPVNSGLYFNGMDATIRSILTQSLAHGIVDAIYPPDKMYQEAMGLAYRVEGRAKMGIYALLRNELVEEAAENFQK